MWLSPYKKRKCQKCHSKCNYQGLVNVWGLGFFVCLFSSLMSSAQLSHLFLQWKVYVLKKSWARRSHKKGWSDNKAEVKWHQTLLVSHAHAHTESHLLGPDNSFARGTTNGSFLSSRNQLQHTCLLLSNSLLLFHELRWPQAAGDGDTCNSSHPLAQIPTPFFFSFFFLLGYRLFPGLSFTTTEPFRAFDWHSHGARLLSLLAMPLLRGIKHSQGIQAFND